MVLVNPIVIGTVFVIFMLVLTEVIVLGMEKYAVYSKHRKLLKIEEEEEKEE